MSSSPPAGVAGDVSSMTGFGRSAGLADGRGWSWELRSVNSRGLDLRLKLAAGFEDLEPALRAVAATRLQRGAVQALMILEARSEPAITVDEHMLARLMQTACSVAARIEGAPVPRVELLMALPGIVRIGTAAPDRASPAMASLLAAGFEAALDALAQARSAEGARLSKLLTAQLREIGTLIGRARDCATGQHVAQRNRLQRSLADLLGGADTAVPEERLAQELALMAARADVREEIDRLDGHVAEAERLLDEGGAIGRRLDFLAQEFNREANTLCSKSATAELTAIGLQLKAAIEQLREQVQNVE